MLINYLRAFRSKYNTFDPTMILKSVDIMLGLGLASGSRSVLGLLNREIIDRDHETQTKNILNQPKTHTHTHTYTDAHITYRKDQILI